MAHLAKMPTGHLAKSINGHLTNDCGCFGECVLDSNITFGSFLSGGGDIGTDTTVAINNVTTGGYIGCTFIGGCRTTRLYVYMDGNLMLDTGDVNTAGFTYQYSFWYPPDTYSTMRVVYDVSPNPTGGLGFYLGGVFCLGVPCDVCEECPTTLETTVVLALPTSTLLDDDNFLQGVNVTAATLSGGYCSLSTHHVVYREEPAEWCSVDETYNDASRFFTDITLSFSAGAGEWVLVGTFNRREFGRPLRQYNYRYTYAPPGGVCDSPAGKTFTLISTNIADLAGVPTVTACDASVSECAALLPRESYAEVP